MNQVRWKREKKENRVSESFETKGCRPRVVLRSQSPIQPQARGTLFALTLSQPLSSKHTSFQPLSSLPSPTLSLSLSLRPSVPVFHPVSLCAAWWKTGRFEASSSTTSVASPFLSFSYSRARAHTHTHLRSREHTRVTRPRFSPPRSNLGRRFAREQTLPLSVSRARSLNGLLAANMADHRLTRDALATTVASVVDGPSNADADARRRDTNLAAIS